METTTAAAKIYNAMLDLNHGNITAAYDKAKVAAVVHFSRS